MDSVDGEALNHLLLDNAAQLLLQKRRQNVEHFRHELDDIIEKYSQDFDGDEIDIFALDVVDDRGHLRNMQHELDPVARALECEPNKSTIILQSVEPDESAGNVEAGWESDESLDELSSQFYNTPTNRKRSSPAHSNKENQRPVLVDVTVASNPNDASTSMPSISPTVQSVAVPDITAGLNLSTDAISAVQAFLAMGKQLESLLQAAVQPVTNENRSDDTAVESFQPRKRRRVEESTGAVLDTRSAIQRLELPLAQRTISPGTSNDEQGRSTDTTSEKRQRSMTPGNCSIWQPSPSGNLYHKPKSTFFKRAGQRTYKKSQVALAYGSGLRNEVISHEVGVNEPVSGSDEAEHSGNSIEPIPQEAARRQSMQGSLPGIFKKSRGRPGVRFSAEEDSLLMELCAQGLPWKDIMAHFPGKSNHQVYYHHKHHLLPQVFEANRHDFIQASNVSQLELDVDVDLLPESEMDGNDLPSPGPPHSLPSVKAKQAPPMRQALSSPSKHTKRVSKQERLSPSRIQRLQDSSGKEQETITLLAVHDVRDGKGFSNWSMAANGSRYPFNGVSRPVRLSSNSNSQVYRPHEDGQDNEESGKATDLQQSSKSVALNLRSINEDPERRPANPEGNPLTSSSTKDMRPTATSAPARASCRIGVRAKPRSECSAIFLAARDDEVDVAPAKSLRKALNTPLIARPKARKSTHSASPKEDLRARSSNSKSVRSMHASVKPGTRERNSYSPRLSSTHKKKSSARKISQFMVEDDQDDLTSDDDVILIRSSPSRTRLLSKGVLKVES